MCWREYLSVSKPLQGSEGYQQSPKQVERQRSSLEPNGLLIRFRRKLSTDVWLTCNVCSGKKVSGRLNFDVVSDLVVASSLSSDQNAKPAAMEVVPVKTPVKCEQSDS